MYNNGNNFGDLPVITLTTDVTDAQIANSQEQRTQSPNWGGDNSQTYLPLQSFSNTNDNVGFENRFGNLNNNSDFLISQPTPSYSSPSFPRIEDRYYFDHSVLSNVSSNSNDTSGNKSFLDLQQKIQSPGNEMDGPAASLLTSTATPPVFVPMTETNNNHYSDHSGLNNVGGNGDYSSGNTSFLDLRQKILLLEIEVNRLKSIVSNLTTMIPVSVPTTEVHNKYYSDNSALSNVSNNSNHTLVNSTSNSTTTSSVSTSAFILSTIEVIDTSTNELPKANEGAKDRLSENKTDLSGIYEVIDENPQAGEDELLQIMAGQYRG